jgi:hypothetical protein
MNKAAVHVNTVGKLDRGVWLTLKVENVRERVLLKLSVNFS